MFTDSENLDLKRAINTLKSSTEFDLNIHYPYWINEFKSNIPRIDSENLVLYSGSYTLHCSQNVLELYQHYKLSSLTMAGGPPAFTLVSVKMMRIESTDKVKLNVYSSEFEYNEEFKFTLNLLCLNEINQFIELMNQKVKYYEYAKINP